MVFLIVFYFLYYFTYLVVLSRAKSIGNVNSFFNLGKATVHCS